MALRGLIASGESEGPVEARLASEWASSAVSADSVDRLVESELTVSPCFVRSVSILPITCSWYLMSQFVSREREVRMDIVSYERRSESMSRFGLRIEYLGRSVSGEPSGSSSYSSVQRRPSIVLNTLPIHSDTLSKSVLDLCCGCVRRGVNAMSVAAASLSAWWTSSGQRERGAIGA